MPGYPVATLQYDISGYEFRWSAGLGVRGRSKWVKSSLYGSIGLVRRGEVTRCDFVMVVLVSNSPVPGRNS